MYAFIRLVFSLPSAVLVPLLRDWLEFEDITELDTSICNHSDRTDYLKVISKDILSPYRFVEKKRRLFDWYCESETEGPENEPVVVDEKNRQIHWTKEMDAKLIEGHDLHFDGKRCHFLQIAEYVGEGITAEQCHDRWRLVNPEYRDRKKGHWSDDEVAQMKELIDQETQTPTGRVRNGVHTLNWKHIGQMLYRSSDDCRHRWSYEIHPHTSHTHHVHRSPKRGHFSPEEDATILQRVQGEDAGHHGLWAMLEKELGHAAGSIRGRWWTLTKPRHDDGDASDLTDSGDGGADIPSAVTGDTSHHLWQLLTVFGRKHPINWTDEMNARLVKYHERYAASSPHPFVKIAKHMRGGLTPQQCRERWRRANPEVQQEKIRKGEWSQHELDQLNILVEREACYPTGRLRHKQHTINWLDIAAEMDRDHDECKEVYAKKHNQRSFPREFFW